MIRYLHLPANIFYPTPVRAPYMLPIGEPVALCRRLPQAVSLSPSTHNLLYYLFYLL
jgi:hypothetical protein